MTSLRRRVAAATALAAALHLPALRAAELPAPRAPYVPTPQIVVETMLDLAQVGPADYVIDLGSGDGRIVTTAARRNGARGLGVELDPNLIVFARQYAREQGVGERVRFVRADLFKTDLRPASVLTLYLLPDMLVELRPKLLATLAPGTRIVAHDFDLGEWRPDEHLSIPVPGKPVGPAPQSDIYLWIVPARVAGRWQGTVGTRPLVLEIDQRYQEVAIAAKLEGRPAAVHAPRLRGGELVFELQSGPVLQLTGKVSGDHVRGATAEGIAWQAVRVAGPVRAAKERAK